MSRRPGLSALLLVLAACSRAASSDRSDAPHAQNAPCDGPVSEPDLSAGQAAHAESVSAPADGDGADAADAAASIRPLLVTAGSPYATRAAAALRLLAASADLARPIAAAGLQTADTATGAARFLRTHATDAETAAIAEALPTARDGRADDLIAALGRVRSPSAAAVLVGVILGADGRRAILAGEAIHANPVPVDRAALVAASAVTAPPARRQAALLALSADPEVGDAPIFRAASQSLAPPFRAVAAGALVRLPDPPQADIVCLLADPDLSVREASARACAELRTPWAADVLSAAFADKASDVRLAAIRSAVCLGSAALPALVDVVKNDRERAGLRGEALRSLSRIDRKAALTALGDTPAIFTGELRSMFEESFGAPPR